MGTISIISSQNIMGALQIGVFGYGAVGQCLGRVLQTMNHVYRFINRHGKIVHKENFFPECILDKVCIESNAVASETIKICSKTKEDSRQFLKTVDIILISVGYSNIRNVARFLKENLQIKRYPLIVFLENYFTPEDLFKMEFPQYPSSRLIFGIADIIAYRIADNHTRVLYPFSFIIGNKNIVDVLRDAHFEHNGQIKTLFLQRLCSHNTAHSMLAYLGYAKGYVYISEAIKDKEIKEKTLTALHEASLGLQRAYGISSLFQKNKIKEEVKKLMVKNFNDPIMRVGRTPIKKLGKCERFILPTILAYDAGVIPEALCEGIAYLLKYRDKNDQESLILSAETARYGVAYILKKYGEVDLSHPIVKRVENVYNIIHIQ